MAKYEGAEVQTTFTGDTTEIEQAEKKVSGSFDNIKSGATLAAAAIGAAFAKIGAEIVGTGIEYNAQIETYLARLETLTGSSEEAAKILNQIKKDAVATPFEVSSLTQAESLLLAAGLSAKDARADILALGDAISASGGGNEELSRMAVNLQQIKNVGKATALDIKQFAYAGIDIYGLIADGMGVTREEVAKLDITYDMLSLSLQKASQKGGKYYKAMDKQSKTYNGAMSNLKESIQVFTGELTEGLFEALKDLVPALTDMFDWLSKNKDVIIAILKPLLAFSGVALGLVAITKVAAGFKLLWTVLTANPIGLVVGAIVALVEIFKLLWDNCEWFRNFWQATWDTIVNIVNGAIGFITTLPRKIQDILREIGNKLTEFVTKTIPKFINDMVNWFLSLPGKVWKALTDTVGKLGQFASDMITEAGRVLPKVIDKIVSFFAELPEKMVKIGKDMIRGLWEGMESMQGWLHKNTKGYSNSLVNLIKGVFGIHSPSTVMKEEVGINLGLGVVEGLDSTKKNINKTIKNMNDEIVRGFSTNLAMNPSILASMSPSNVQPIVNVYNSMDMDPLGQVVSNVKTFSGGAKNDYNYGVGV